MQKSKNNKLEIVEQSVYSEAQKICDQIQQQIDSLRSETLKKAREESRVEAQEYIKQGQAKIKRVSSAEISKSKLEAKRQLLKYRAQLIDGLFEEIRAKLSEFSKSDGYQNFISSRLEDIQKQHKLEDMIFFINPDDKIADNIIKKLLGQAAKIEKDISIKLGGFRVLLEQSGVSIDETLDSRLLEQRKWFAENYNSPV